ncbi:MAG: tetratricopeptide repeat protein [Acidobacteria bacterium]|nr:tetratricopeptide repeat protein [Acidobacteriota bacterium]
MPLRFWSFLLLTTLLIARSAVAQAPATSAHPPVRQIVPFAAMLFYEEARTLAKANKPDEAMAKLKRAIEEYPDFFQARFDLAQELFRRKEMVAAFEMLEAARRLNDRDARVYRLFGTMMLEQGKPKMAEFGFRQAIERDPAFAQTYQAHGAALTDLALQETASAARANWLTQAELQLRKSLELSEGKLGFSHLHLARVYEARGEKLKAAQELETFLLKNPRAANEKAIREAVAKLRASEK